MWKIHFFCDVVIGNLPEVVKQKHDLLHNAKNGIRIGPDDGQGPKESHCDENLKKIDKSIITQAVTTRLGHEKANRKEKPLKVTALKDIGDPADFKLAQEEDASLFKERKWAEIGKVKYNPKAHSETSYRVDKGLLYRIVTKQKLGLNTEERQLVVPKKYRQAVLNLGHETLLAGHMGIVKTTDRIQSNFFWPGMHLDVQNFCRSCDICQRTVPRGRVAKAPLGQMPIVNTPFQRVAVDLIGPIQPVSNRGHRYILTMVDMATRYPKAMPLKNIDSVTVAEALIKMFSDVGFPAEMLSDRGTQFTSDMMKEVERLVSIKPLVTTPYHAQCNGLCEKFNGTLKQMLKKMVGEQPKDWDRYIEPLLFAYRETPVESLAGFSPFEVLYGRPVRGPMSVLKEVWSNEEVQEAVKDTYEYVLDLRDRLEETRKLVSEGLQKAQDNQKRYFDRKAIHRELKEEDKVLILLPTDENKLLMRWRGPYPVRARIGMNNYAVDINGKSKVYHINMLKQYFDRGDLAVEATEAGAMGIIDDQENNEISPGEATVTGKIFGTPKDAETHLDVNINEALSDNQKEEVQELVAKYSDIFSSIPGTTHLVKHDIVLGDDVPVRTKPYPVPYAKYEEMKTQIDEMLQLGIIEVSESPYCSPLVMVKKKDGSMRYCQDMRNINRKTKFDCERPVEIDSIFAKLCDDRYFSKFDCCRGYWQIPLTERAKEITGFSTPFGHYQFVKMPFGLVNSGATYEKMMRKLLGNLECIDHYVDDVLEHTRDWSEHMRVMENFLQKVRQANLTLKPSKCYLGYFEAEFLGHKVVNGTLATQDDKSEKIRNSPIPNTKKQLRSFLGLCSYYRRYIPNFAEIAFPLTELTKKKMSEKLALTDVHRDAIEKLKEIMCSGPILKLPNVKERFVLRTDASNVGIGAVLMQYHEGELFPVMYASRKLLPREKNYAVIEKECLALVWAIGKFEVYLYGQEFTIQTDHRSLEYLDKAKFSNARIMRWALSLQPYKYKIEYIKGEDNVGADFLSRNI